MKLIDLTGKRFGRLKVIERCGYNKHKKIKWLCICDCGNEIEVLGNSLRQNCTHSCGCLQIERAHNKAANEKRSKKFSGSNNPNWKGGIYSSNTNHYYRMYQLRKSNALKDLTEAEIEKIKLYYQKGKELGPDWHIDHINPLSKGGKHHPDNLQIIPKAENLKKYNKLDYEVPKELIIKL